MTTFRRPTTTALSIAPIDRPSFERFIVLSLLLHVLVVMLFGDASGGGERRGAHLWGAFRATLVSNAGEAGPGLKLDRAVDLGSLAARRPPENLPLTASSVPARIEPLMPASSPTEVSTATQEGARAAPPQPGSSPTPEVLPYIAKDTAKPETSFVVSPPTSIPDVVAPVADKPRLVPLTPLQNAEPVAAQKRVRELTPYIAPKPLAEAPLIPPMVPLSVPTIEREPAAALLMPRILPLAPTPALTPLVPARIEREYAPIAELLAPMVPVVPAASKRELAPYVAPKIEPEAIPAVVPASEPVARPAPRETPLAPTDTIQREVPTHNERELAPPAGRVRDAAPPAQAATPGVPADTLSSRRELPSPSLPSTTAAPRLDLDAIRNRARNMPSEGSGPRTVFQFPTPPPQAIKSRDAKIFDRALKRPDCRDAYAGLGLAAVVPLVADAITNKGCKW